MKSTEKIMDFVNRIKTLENKLAAVGHIFQDDETRRILLFVAYERTVFLFKSFDSVA